MSTLTLDEDLWIGVKLTIDAPPQSGREREHYSRCADCFHCCTCVAYASRKWLATDGEFFCRCDKDSEERRRLEILGKSDELRMMPATSELMVELARNRRQLGPAPCPLPAGATPLLLLPIGGKSMTRGVAWRGAACHANRVMLASAHWLRHTAGSHTANNNIDLRHIRDNGQKQSFVGNRHYSNGDQRSDQEILVKPEKAAAKVDMIDRCTTSAPILATRRRR